MTTVKSIKTEPVSTSNNLSFLHGAMHAVTGTVSGKSTTAVSLFTLPLGATIHHWAVGYSEVFTLAGSVGVGVTGTVEKFAVVPVPYAGAHTIVAAQLNTALAAETAVIGTLFASHGTTPGTLAVTCFFSLPG